MVVFHLKKSKLHFLMEKYSSSVVIGLRESFDLQQMTIERTTL